MTAKIEDEVVLNLGQHQTLQEVVSDTLRNLILNGTFKPGQRLRQDELADQLGVSTMPIREALRRLEAEGLVTTLPRRGAIVSELRIEEIEEIYLMRAALECLITRLAVPQLTSAQIAKLQQLFKRMAEALEAKDFVELFQLNRDFHLAIYEAAKKPIINENIIMLWDRSEIYRRAYLNLPQRMEQAHQEHEAILHACERRDPVEAEQMIRINVEQTANVLFDHLKRT